MNNNKNLWISLIIVVLFVVGIIWWSKSRSTVAVDTTPTEDVSDGSADVPAASAPAKLLSYNDALVTYKDRRIQFNETCTAFPFSVDYKNGTNIMLDNRSHFPRSITIGANVYPIKAYGFKIVKVSAPKVPSNFSVDCDAQQNVGTISLRK